MAEPLSPALSLPAWRSALASLAKGVHFGRANAVRVSKQAELPFELPATEVHAPAEEPFRIVGAQQMCRGKSECQDAFGSFVGDGWFVACIADGAGSSPCSRQGAQAAVGSALDYLSRDRGGDPVERITEAFRASQRAVLDLALSEERDAKDFRTTLAVAIGNLDQIVSGHVGDSLVVVADSLGVRPLLRPKNGEFGNTTFFITSPDFESHLEFATTEGPWTGLAMQTDGLEAVTYWKHRDDLETATYQALFSIIERLPAHEAQDELNLFVSEDAIMDKCNDDLTLLCVVPNAAPYVDASTPDRSETA